MMISVFDGVGNIMGKVENACLPAFSPFPTIFSKGFFLIVIKSLDYVVKGKYSITCIKRPLKGSNESGLVQQVVFKCRFYQVDLKSVDVSEQWSFKAGGLLRQVVSNTG